VHYTPRGNILKLRNNAALNISQEIKAAFFFRQFGGGQF
jgi:hypothetical protein